MNIPTFSNTQLFHYAMLLIGGIMITLTLVVFGLAGYTIVDGLLHH